MVIERVPYRLAVVIQEGERVHEGVDADQRLTPPLPREDAVVPAVAVMDHVKCVYLFKSGWSKGGRVGGGGAFPEQEFTLLTVAQPLIERSRRFVLHQHFEQHFACAPTQRVGVDGLHETISPTAPPLG